jgi:hypothetical protein
MTDIPSSAQENIMPHVSPATAEESVSLLGIDVRLTHVEGGEAYLVPSGRTTS